MTEKSNHYIRSIIFSILLILTSRGKKHIITPDRRKMGKKATKTANFPCFKNKLNLSLI